MAGGALAAIASLLLVLPSMDIGEIGDFDPAVDYSLRWLTLAGVVASVLVVVLAIAGSRAHHRPGTPDTEADAR